MRADGVVARRREDLAPGPPVALTAGLAFSDRIEALLDGRVEPTGVGLTITCRPPQVLFQAVLREQTYDLSEFSLGSHIAAVGAGAEDYVGLPVFLSRAFRHSNVYVRADRGVARPQDLRGRRIGVTDFHQTAALWVRGLLADDYDVDPQAVTWITAGLAAPVLEDRTPLRLPAGLTVERSPQTLNVLLETGEIDAVISPIAPRMFRARDPRVRRLWPDYQAMEIDYFRRTKLFPIMHVLVLRRRILERRPEVAGALTQAFERAKALATDDVEGRDYPKIATPWLIADRERTLQALGEDPWTYGLEANRPALETLLRYAQADGLTRTRLQPEALFAQRAAGRAGVVDASVQPVPGSRSGGGL